MIIVSLVAFPIYIGELRDSYSVTYENTRPHTRACFLVYRKIYFASESLVAFPSPRILAFSSGEGVTVGDG